MNVDRGEIRELKEDEQTEPREIELTLSEKELLEKLPPWKRLGVFASSKKWKNPERRGTNRTSPRKKKK